MTRYTPGVVEVGLHVPVTAVVPVTVILAGHPGVRPVSGEVRVVRVTRPVKPPDGVTVMVELPVAPELKSAGDDAETVKSPPLVTVADTWTALEAVPTLPVTVIV